MKKTLWQGRRVFSLIFALFIFLSYTTTGVKAEQKISVQKNVSTLSKDNKFPQLMLKDSVFNAGEIYGGKEVTHSFTIANKGGVDLLIASVKPG